MAKRILTEGMMRQLVNMPPERLAAFIAKLPVAEVLRFDAWFEAWADRKQLPPSGEGWRNWLLMAGRGFGKTRAGAEWVHGLAMPRRGTRIALVGATLAEARSVMVEGRSGLIATAAVHGVRFKYEPGIGRLRWPGGSEAQIFSGDSPEQLRGPEHHYAWLLTFEIFGEGTPVSLGEMLEELSDEVIAGGALDLVGGYAAYGKTVAAAIEPLTRLYGLEFEQHGGGVSERGDETEVVGIDEHLLGATRSPGETGAAVERSRLPIASLPRRVQLDHYDPSRDYQVGRVSSEGSDDAREDLTIDAPLTAGSDEARGLVERALRDLYRKRERIELRLAPAMSSLRPGDIVSCDGLTWRLDAVEHEEGIVLASGSLSGSGMIPIALESDPGSASLSKDLVASKTEIGLFDVPDLGRGPQSRVLLAAASSSEGWKSVPVEWEIGGQTDTTATSGRESRLGVAETVLAASSSLVPDNVNEVVIEMIDHEHWLEPASELQLYAGKNLAIFGDELIQFSRAVPLGDGRFSLGGMLRGLRGTEWAAATHSAGDKFVLLETDRLISLDIARERIGATILATPLGLADSGTETVAQPFNGEGLRPPSPAHFVVVRESDGSVSATWIPRSRLAWGWTDGPEPGLGEVAMSFLLTIDGETTSFVIETQSNAVNIDAGTLAQFVGEDVSLSLVAVGDQGTSHPVLQALSL